MAQLAEDEGDLVTEQRGRVVHAAGERLHSWHGGGEIGRRGQVAEGEHGSVALEEREGGVEEGLLELGDGRRFGRFGKGRCRVDRCKVAVEGSVLLAVLYSLKSIHQKSNEKPLSSKNLESKETYLALNFSAFPFSLLAHSILSTANSAVSLTTSTSSLSSLRPFSSSKLPSNPNAPSASAASCLHIASSCRSSTQYSKKGTASGFPDWPRQ